MAFKMSPIGKKKCPYSPMQNKGLINPSPVMNKGDEKKAKSDAEKKADANMKVVKTTKTKLDDGRTEVRQFLEGKGESFSKDPAVRAKQKQWAKDNPELYQQMLADKKAERVSYIEKPKEKTVSVEPKKKAKPIDKNIGTKIKDNKVIVGYRAERIDGKLIKTPIYEEVKKRVAVSTTADDKTGKDLDQNVRYSSTGDKQQTKINVEQDLAETKKAFIKSSGG